MNCAQVLFSLFLLAPCDDQAGGHEAIASALAHPARPAADRERDAGRKPGEVLEFFGIEPGMTVLEVFAGGGYYTQILDALVGESGRVLAHNNPAYLNFVGEQFEARFADGGLPRTERLIAEANEIELPADSLDAALLSLTWHDFLFGAEEYGWPDVDEEAFLDLLCAAMKPGAILGVVDHVAKPGGDPGAIAQTLHRVDPASVRTIIGASCFTLAAESDLLRNPADDHSTSATQGPLQGQTDRFVMRFVREPEG